MLSFTRNLFLATQQGYGRHSLSREQTFTIQLTYPANTLTFLLAKVAPLGQLVVCCEKFFTEMALKEHLLLAKNVLILTKYYRTIQYYTLHLYNLHLMLQL